MNLYEFVWGMILGIFLGFVAVLFTVTHYDVQMQELCRKKEYDFCKPVQQYEIVFEVLK